MINKQMVLRLSTTMNDFEIAYDNGIDEPKFKNISVSEVYESLKNLLIHANFEKKNLKLLDKDIIAINSSFYVIKQDERKRIVSTNFDDELKSYKINYPNMIYVVNYRSSHILQIQLFSYKKYDGLETVLYEYPLPNELTGNRLCFGSADTRIIDDNIVEALERIIGTAYTHKTFSGLNGYNDTTKLFEFISKNPFPYEYMKGIKKKLVDILK